jgi:hypothetical protein
MADDVNDLARVRALAALHVETQASAREVLAQRSTLPMFIRHQDGSVQTRDGQILRGKTEPPAKKV